LVSSCASWPSGSQMGDNSCERRESVAFRQHEFGAIKEEGVQVLLMEEDDNDLYDDDSGE